MPVVHLLDYVAGNVRSLVNAIEKVGYTVEWIKAPEDIKEAQVSLSTWQRLGCYALNSTLEFNPAWCGTLWPLPIAIRQGRLSRTYPKACGGRKAFSRHLRWLASLVRGV